MISPISNDRKTNNATSPQNGEVDANTFKTRLHVKSRWRVFAILHQDIELILAYVAHYLAARTDAVKVKIRRAIFWIVAAILVLVATIAAVITGVILIFSGIADAMASVFGDRAWAGNLTTGILMLVIIALTTYGGMNSLLKYSYRQLKYNYDRRRKAESGLHHRAETESSQPEC
jgi:hypothetical protein